jgi:ketosteroid isomerase-like protein
LRAGSGEMFNNGAATVHRASAFVSVMCKHRTMNEVPEIVRTFLGAWTQRDPAIATVRVTSDVTITDPNQSVIGPEALVKHLEIALHHFDFDVEYGQCWGEPDDFVFRCRIALVGRSKHFAHIRTGFEPAVFVKLRDGLIASWAEYWDPRALNEALASKPAD